MIMSIKFSNCFYFSHPQIGYGWKLRLDQVVVEKNIVEALFSLFDFCSGNEANTAPDEYCLDLYYNQKTYNAILHAPTQYSTFSCDDFSHFAGLVSELFYLPKALEKDKWYYMHGGAVERYGKAFLFLGSTKTGKSTLITRLVTKGYSYLTDDVIPIYQENLNVVAFPKAIYLRDKRWVSDCNNMFSIKSETIYLHNDERYVVCPKTCVLLNKQLPIAAIFDLRRNNQNRYNNTLLNKSLAFPILYMGSRSPYEMAKNRLMASALAQNIPVFSLEYDDPDVCIAQIIDNFADSFLE